MTNEVFFQQIKSGFDALIASNSQALQGATLEFKNVIDNTFTSNNKTCNDPIALITSLIKFYVSRDEASHQDNLLMQQLSKLTEHFTPEDPHTIVDMLSKNLFKAFASIQLNQVNTDFITHIHSLFVKLLQNAHDYPNNITRLFIQSGLLKLILSALDIKKPEILNIPMIYTALCYEDIGKSFLQTLYTQYKQTNNASDVQNIWLILIRNGVIDASITLDGFGNSSNGFGNFMDFWHLDIPDSATTPIFNLLNHSTFITLKKADQAKIWNLAYYVNILNQNRTSALDKLHTVLDKDLNSSLKKFCEYAYIRIIATGATRPPASKNIIDAHLNDSNGVYFNFWTQPFIDYPDDIKHPNKNYAPLQSYMRKEFVGDPQTTFQDINKSFDLSYKRAIIFDLRGYQGDPVIRYVAQLRTITGKISNNAEYSMIATYYLANIAKYIIETVNESDHYHHHVIPEITPKYLIIDEEYKKELSASIRLSLIAFGKSAFTAKQIEVLANRINFVLKNFGLDFNDIILSDPDSRLFFTDKIADLILTGELDNVKSTFIYQQLSLHNKTTGIALFTEKLTHQPRDINVFLDEIHMQASIFTADFTNKAKILNETNFDCANTLIELCNKDDKHEYSDQAAVIAIKAIISIIKYRFQSFYESKYDKKLYRNHLKSILNKNITLEMTQYLNSYRLFFISAINKHLPDASDQTRYDNHLERMQFIMDFLYLLFVKFNITIEELDVHARFTITIMMGLLNNSIQFHFIDYLANHSNEASHKDAFLHHFLILVKNDEMGANETFNQLPYISHCDISALLKYFIFDNAVFKQIPLEKQKLLLQRKDSQGKTALLMIMMHMYRIDFYALSLEDIKKYKEFWKNVDTQNINDPYILEFIENLNTFKNNDEEIVPISLHAHMICNIIYDIIFHVVHKKRYQPPVSNNILYPFTDAYKSKIKISIQKSLMLLIDSDTQHFQKLYNDIKSCLYPFHLTYEEMIAAFEPSRKIINVVCARQYIFNNALLNIIPNPFYLNGCFPERTDKLNPNVYLFRSAVFTASRNYHLNIGNYLKADNHTNKDCVSNIIGFFAEESHEGEAHSFVRILMEIIHYRIISHNEEKYDKKFYLSYLKDILCVHLKNDDVKQFLAQYKHIFIARIQLSLNALSPENYEDPVRALSLKNWLDLFIDKNDYDLLDKNAQHIYQRLLMCSSSATSDTIIDSRRLPPSYKSQFSSNFDMNSSNNKDCSL